MQNMHDSQTHRSSSSSLGSVAVLIPATVQIVVYQHVPDDRQHLVGNMCYGHSRPMPTRTPYQTVPIEDHIGQEDASTAMPSDMMVKNTSLPDIWHT